MTVVTSPAVGLHTFGLLALFSQMTTTSVPRFALDGGTNL